jgi:hypothetical protein
LIIGEAMTTTARHEDRRELVQAAEKMDRETFCKHMSLRHEENLGGLPGLDPDPLFTSDYVEDCWRAFHRQLHALHLQENLDHEHMSTVGFLVTLRLPDRIQPEAALHELRTCVSFGQAGISLQYVVPDPIPEQDCGQEPASNDPTEPGTRLYEISP